MTVYAILLAAGSSTRMGFDKLYTPLGGKTAVLRSAEALKAAGAVSAVVTASEDNFIQAEQTPWPFPVRIVRGGQERRDSVLLALEALEALEADEGDVVLIHDAARCFMPSARMAAAAEDAQKTGSGVLALPMRDSVFRKTDTGCENIPRTELYRTQTPQAFRYGEILEAYHSADGTETDDAAAYEKRFGRLTLTEGSETGRKLTTPEDWAWARMMSEPARFGTGFDTHVLVEGRKLILGGVEIPFEKGLLGHSDADVLLHAISDALLGAAALGDIGKHFSDSDPKYKNIDSRILFREAVRLVKELGYEIHSIDATVICERPKMNPHFQKMRENIAADAGVPVEAVSLKATTTEKMNDEGRGLCVSAQAAVSIGAPRA